MKNKRTIILTNIIKYEDVENLLNEILNSISKRNDEIKLIVNLNKNTLDAISIYIESKIMNRTLLDQLFNIEYERQIGKTLTNNIGKFNEKILSKISNSEWFTVGSKDSKGLDFIDIVNGSGYDVKNKHNTMNSSGQAKLWSNFNNLIINESNGIKKCYLLEVISKKSVDSMWKVSDKGVILQRPEIKKISLDLFLEKITNDSNAINEYLSIIINFINQYFDSNYPIKKHLHDNIEEKDVFKSLFTLSFSQYDNFDINKILNQVKK